MFVTALYITKNEQDNIVRSINSCRAIADEIIVVDTGSTDNTVKNAKELGAKVVNYKWENDFSLARNFAISQCKNGYILFLDADEYFDKSLISSQKEEIEQVVLQNEDGVFFKSLDKDKEAGKSLFTSYAVKFFRKAEDIYYKASIHEHLFKKSGDFKVGYYSNALLIHDGYSKNVMKAKVQRNIDILNKIENKTAMDYYYLTRENLSLGNYKIADYCCSCFFKKEDYNDYIEKTNLAYQIYFYKISIMGALPEKYTAEDIKKAYKEMEESIGYIPEVSYRIGEYYFNRNLEKSEKYLLKCLTDNETYSNQNLKVNSFVGFQPRLYYLLSKISFMLHKPDETVRRAAVALILDKSELDYWYWFCSTLQKNRYEDNINYIDKIIRPSSEEDYYNLTKATRKANLFQEFVHYAQFYNTKFSKPLTDLYYAMILSEEFVSVLESVSMFRQREAYEVGTMAILASGDLTYFETYKDWLPENYCRIGILLTALQSGNFEIPSTRDSFFDEKENREILTHMIINLHNCGILLSKRIREGLVTTTLETNEIKQALEAYAQTGDYNTIFSFFETYKSKTKTKVIDTSLLTMYFLTCLRTKHYEEFISEYHKSVATGVLTKANMNRGLLSAIPTKKLNPQSRKLKREYAFN